MRPFAYERVNSVPAAIDAITALDAAAAPEGDRPNGRDGLAFLAGGTTLIDLMKLEVMQPRMVVDINALQRSAAGRIEVNADGLVLGALARMSDAAEHPDIRRDYPLIVQALELAASPQLRIMASLGGNVLQRTRCPYFRDSSYAHCNKRNAGSGCDAIRGYNRRHAILGTSEHCIATYPGDFAQALIALDATVEIMSAAGPRTIPFADLHRRPGDTPDVETTLEPGELITAFTVPALPWARRSVFLKIRDRESYEFALASAAVALDLEQGGRVREARIALGGLATVPWRAHAAETALKGHTVAEAAEAAADAAFADAQPQSLNAFKLPLGKRTVRRALRQAATMDV